MRISVICAIFAILSAAVAVPLREASTGAQEPFSEELAAKYVVLSALSHCSDSTLQRWDCKLCTHNATGLTLTGIVKDKKHALRGFVAYNDDEIVVSFRGSVMEEFGINWILDFDVVRIHPFEQEKNVSVHAGFWTSFEAVREQVLELVNKAPSRPVLTFTGHSLGATLASLMALNVSSQLPNHATTLRVYNFGCPRMGNEAFAQLLAVKVPNAWRVVNQRDLVPHYPGEELGYRHGSSEAWYHHGSYHLCQGAEDNKCSNSEINFDILNHVTYPPFPPGVVMSESASCK